MDRKTALITGVTGQDGSYLSELLLEKDYRVIGLHRRSSTNTFERISHLVSKENFELVEWDITDPVSVSGVINNYKPDELYNLAAQSHVKTSFEQPVYTSLVNYMGVQYLLDSIVKYSPRTKFYQAGTSEEFGNNSTWSNPKASDYFTNDGVGVKYQSEKTPFAPNSPYAVSKVAAHYLVNNYIRAYGIFACVGILFNHESERRGEEFVTRKITKWIGNFVNFRETSEKLDYDLYVSEPGDAFCDKIISFKNEKIVGARPKLRLGNLDAKRDWGHSEDYVRGMYLMLQQNKCEDHVLATGYACSIKDFLDAAFKEIGIDDWSPYVVIDPKFYRPSDVEYLLGDASKAKRELGWEPTVSFEELVHRMVQSDIEKERK